MSNAELAYRPFFFPRTRRKAAHLCIKRKKGWSNYGGQHLTLGQSEGCIIKNLVELLQKKVKLGPDYTTPASLSLLYHPPQV